MSAFKRHQSKVFWSHMASQDLESLDPFASRNDFANVKQNIAHNLEVAEEETEEEHSSSINDTSDTIDAENVTAIRVCLNENDERQYSRMTTIHEENLMTQTVTMEIKDEDKGDENNIVLANRSCSPLSQDLRSLDSGFSDSERSNCSEFYENETPRRRRRKRVKDRRHGMHSRIGAVWLENETIPNPAYTSTPKDSRILPRNKMILNTHEERGVSRSRSNAIHI